MLFNYLLPSQTKDFPTLFRKAIHYPFDNIEIKYILIFTRYVSIGHR